MIDRRTEGWISIAGSIMVLFTAMLDPWVSAILATTLLLGLGVYSILATRA